MKREELVAEIEDAFGRFPPSGLRITIDSDGRLPGRAKSLSSQKLVDLRREVSETARWSIHVHDR